MSFETSDFATQFYQAYHLQLLQEVFAVMTGDHQPPCSVCCALYQAPVVQLCLSGCCNAKTRCTSLPNGAAGCGDV